MTLGLAFLVVAGTTRKTCSLATGWSPTYIRVATDVSHPPSTMANPAVLWPISHHMNTRRCRCWMRNLLAALVVVVASTPAPASAFVLKVPHTSDFSPTTRPSERRAAGLCERRPQVAGAFCSRHFLEQGDGGSHRDRNAALRLVGQEGGGLAMDYRDSGTRSSRCSGNQKRGVDLVSPPRLLTYALPVPHPRGSRVRVNGGNSGGRSYGEISGSRGTNHASSSTSSNSTSTSTSTNSNSTSGEVRDGSNTSPVRSQIPRLEKRRNFWMRPLQFFRPRDLSEFLVISNLNLPLGPRKSRFRVFLGSNNVESWDKSTALKVSVSRGLRGSPAEELPWTIADAFDDEIR